MVSVQSHQCCFHIANLSAYCLALQDDQSKEDRKRKKKRKHDEDAELDSKAAVKAGLLATPSSSGEPCGSSSTSPSLPRRLSTSSMSSASSKSSVVSAPAEEPGMKRRRVQRKVLQLSSSMLAPSNSDSVHLAVPGSVQAGSLSSPKSQSCQALLCHLPTDESTGWAQCEVCQNLFHIVCVGLVPDSADTVELYTCGRCSTSARSSSDSSMVQKSEVPVATSPAAALSSTGNACSSSTSIGTHCPMDVSWELFCVPVF